MIINHKNIKLIEKKIYLHDTVFDGLIFDNINKKIELKIYNIENKNNTILIQFNNVIGFEANCFCFWSRGCHILNWEYINEKDYTIINKLENDLKMNDNYKEPLHLFEEKFIETEFILNSGDRIRIACEYINYQNYNLI